MNPKQMVTIYCEGKNYFATQNVNLAWLSGLPQSTEMLATAGFIKKKDWNVNFIKEKKDFTW